MQSRIVSIRVVSNGTAQWNSFFKSLQGIISNGAQIISQTNTVISPGKTASEIELETNVDVSNLRRKLSAKQCEIVSIFCPNEATEERPSKRKRRRRRGKRKKN